MVRKSDKAYEQLIAVSWGFNKGIRYYMNPTTNGSVKSPAKVTICRAEGDSLQEGVKVYTQAEASVKIFEMYLEEYREAKS